MSVNLDNMPPQIQQNYTDKLLSTPERNNIHNLFASVIEIADNDGFINRQSRYEALDTFEVPLENAQLNPPAQLLSRVDVDCRVRNYATYLVITKFVAMTNQDPILNASAARLGQAYKETSDILQRDNLESTASVVNCTGGSNGDLPTEISLQDADDITSVMQDNDGEYVTSMIDASDRIGTSPLGDAYAAMCHTRLIPALNAISGFRRKFEYGTGYINTLSSEWGGVNNTRFYVSSQGSITPSASLLGNDVANVFITAQEGYKVVFKAGGRAKYYYTPPGGQQDPAHLRQMAACQFYQGNCVNNDLWVQNLRSTGLREV
ncbi:MAG: N4-gp56 family major capsid protein [Candidatus Peribacteraceae bacterium]|nr:N4-gp56 family major capsid protein [Candidatus Peribacteraceae bacterium]